MIQIPNHPLRRTKQFLTEAGGPSKRTWWQRRYRPATLVTDEEWLVLPRNRLVRPKKSDADWREVCDSWVLLSYQGNFGCHVFYKCADVSSRCMRTLLPVQTRLFAMRISSDPVQVMVCDSDDASKVRAPEFYHPQSTKPFVAETMDMFVFCHNIGQSVTFI